MKIAKIIILGLLLFIFVLSGAGLVYAQMVERTPVSNIKIVSCPSDLGDIAVMQTVNITLHQYSTVDSSGYVKIEPVTSAAWGFAPENEMVSMEPGAEMNYQFTVYNYGQEQTKACQFNVSIYNTFGELTDSRTVLVALDAVASGSTSLEVNTIDKVSGKDVNAIHVTVIYDKTNYKDAWTLDGKATFDFEGRMPKASIYTDASSDYQQATTTLQMVSGNNQVTLQLDRAITYVSPMPQQQGYFSNIPLVLVVAFLIAAIVIIVVILAVHKYKKRNQPLP